jgi:hypothetical protein
MFIQFGDKRINLSLIKQYRPKENNHSHFIEFTYLDGSKDAVHFFDRKEEMDKYLENLDKNFLQLLT